MVGVLRHGHDRTNQSVLLANHHCDKGYGGNYALEIDLITVMEVIQH